MRYLTAILFGLLAAGCGDKAADNLMTQASVLIEEHPDSALLALRQIDPSAISPAADARRRLLLAQTYSRTGAEADNDSQLLSEISDKISYPNQNIIPT